MPKLMRALVLGAMLAVLSSATAAVAQPPAPPDQAVQQYRDGERAQLGQPVSNDQAVQRFRAGERASQTEPAAASDQAVQQFRAGERSSSRPARWVVTGPAAPLVLRVHPGPPGRPFRPARRPRNPRGSAGRPGRRRGAGPLP